MITLLLVLKLFQSTELTPHIYIYIYICDNDYLILFSGDCDLCISLAGLKTTTKKVPY